MNPSGVFNHRKPNTQVLKNFNLTIHPGQAVALVGASGSGKSTIVGLLEKFYQADSGQIILDGNDVNEIDPRWLHRNIGIVTQEPTLFASSIRDNILYARAMIQDPKLLLLDEATSALDTQSESIVQEALNKLMEGRTSIIIAHRLSTVIDSDVIVVMNKEEIKEIGTHLELVNMPDGYYRKLASKQMLLPGGPSTNTQESSDGESSDGSDDEGEEVW